jgi:hypothetical protein
MAKRAKLYFILIITSILFSSCVNYNGKKCAYVYIYNPTTGTESDLDLLVEVYDYEIVKIYWENGGWLDDSHFKKGSTTIDNNGEASFIDDRGREFSVTIQDDSNCSW